MDEDLCKAKKHEKKEKKEVKLHPTGGLLAKFKIRIKNELDTGAQKKEKKPFKSNTK